ncbi:MAG: PucR family transcriptional regulator ligand-binding domain-containing protein [Candidatus Pelethousia sp.]|nr:PucR family transcriptional regulator ligand-binding domain-containing protein [Candidatus Pelethousia sp.]
MQLTVREAMKLKPLCNGEVIAGISGLDRVIGCVSAMEVLDFTEFLEPDMLAISSLYAIANDFDSQLSFVRMMNDYHASALMLFNVGPVMPYISQDLIALCDELAFPLINMPPHISYYDVFKAVLDQLLERQVHKLQDSIQLYEAYMNQLLDVDEHYSSLLDTLSETVGSNVLFFDHNQKFVYHTRPDAQTPSAQTIQLIQGHLVGLIDRPKDMLFVEIAGVSYLFMPVSHKYTYYGALVIENIENPMSDLAKLAISQTCRALCITIFNSERQDEYRKRMRREYLRDILTGNFGDKGLIISQGQALDFNITDVTGVLVIHPAKTGAHEETEDLLKSCAVYAERLTGDSIITILGDAGDVVILSTNKNRQDLLQAGKGLAALLESSEIQATVGIGPVCEDVQMIPDCYKKAQNAMRISDKLFCHPHHIVACYDDLKVFDLLLESVERQKAKTIVDELFRPVDTYDSTYNGQLADTFFALLVNSVSTSQVSQEMYLHKNTVLQRKNKIAGFYSDDPFSSSNRLRFELGYILKKIFDL